MKKNKENKTKKEPGKQKEKQKHSQQVAPYERLVRANNSASDEFNKNPLAVYDCFNIDSRRRLVLSSATTPS